MSVELNAFSNAVDTTLSAPGTDALGSFDNIFADVGINWNGEYWYFVMDDTSKPSEYVLHQVNFTIHHYQSGHSNDPFYLTCNINDDGPDSGTWNTLISWGYQQPIANPPITQTNQSFNLTDSSVCGLDTWSELNKLRIKIHAGVRAGEDDVTWYVDYLNATVWYTAYGIPEITQIRAYESSSETIGSGALMCDVTAPEDSSADTCAGFEGSTTYRVEIKVKNVGEDSLTIHEVNHTLMDSVADSVTSCGYDDGTHSYFGDYNDECGIIGTNITMLETGTPISIASNGEYWFYYIFTTKSSISNQADSYIMVYDDDDSGSTISTLSDDLDINVVGPPDTITVSLYSDAAYSVPLRTFDVGDTVYVEALIQDSNSAGINTGTTDCNFTFDDAYDGSFEGNDISIVSLSNVGGGEWQGSWDSTGSGDALYLASVNNSNAAAVFGSTEFHLYSGSGISAYKMDEDGDSNDDYFLENKHLVAVYNGASAASNYLLELYQKDTDVSYTFYDIADSNMMGQSSPSSSDSAATEMVTISLNESEADSLDIVNLDIENSLGSSQIEIIVAPDFASGELGIQNRTMVFENNSGLWYNAYNFTNAFRSANTIQVVDIDSDDRLETVIGIETYLTDIILQIFENQSGGMDSVYNISKAGLGDSAIEIEVADFDNDGGDDLEILICTGSSGNPHQSAIFKKIGSDWVNYYNISSGIGTFSGCAGIASGDMDGDGDIEFIVSEEWVDPNEYLMIRMFENQSNTWENTINYTSFVLDTGPDLFGLEIGDVNNDGWVEIVAVPDGGPIQIINYTGSAMVSLWNLTNPVDSRCLVVGDMTNDGKIDIVTTHDDENVIIVFENVSNSITNTFNISVADLGRCARGGQQMDLGDIDADGKNELVLVSDSADYLKVYRGSSLIGSFTLPTSNAAAVEIGDVDNDANSASSFLNIT
ncbi:MAG: VCBS repeat-containing protein, partial [Candidatus Thorarchaeota archaeon]